MAELGFLLAAPLLWVALFMVLVGMSKGIFWLSVRIGLGRALKDWRLWLGVAACYAAFTADWVVAQFGSVVGWSVLAVLVMFAFCLVIDVAAELKALNRDYEDEGW